MVISSSPNFRARRSGFTLIELLVVMGIIAILAGVTLAGVSSAIKFAKRTKANTTASQIATAVQNYYTEYGVYPTTGNGSSDDYYSGTSAGNWPELIITLCGNINPATGNAAAGIANANTRQIAYLSPTRSQVDTSGAIVNPFATIPTGGGAATGVPGPYFYMAVDTDYSGVVGDTGTQPPDFTQTTVGSTIKVPGGVAVWCSCDQALTGSPTQFWAHTY